MAALDGGLSTTIKTPRAAAWLSVVGGRVPPQSDADRPNAAPETSRLPDVARIALLRPFCLPTHVAGRPVWVTPASRARQVHVVLNWFEELKRLVPN